MSGGRRRTDPSRRLRPDRLCAARHEPVCSNDPGVITALYPFARAIDADRRRDR